MQKGQASFLPLTYVHTGRAQRKGAQMKKDELRGEHRAKGTERAGRNGSFQSPGTS